jgi:hypothetical protein
MPRQALALSLVASLLLSSGAFAAPKKSAPKAEEAQPENAVALESVNALLQKWRCGAVDAAKCPIKTSPSVALEGFRWGATKREVLEVYTRSGGLIDQKFEPMLAKANSSSAMKDIEAERIMAREVATGQDLFEFDDKPNGLDATFLWKSREYSKANGESCFKLSTGLGVGAIDSRIVRYFFFFGKGDAQRLWKIYEELPLGATSPFGADFQAAVNKLAESFGVMGRLRTAGQGEGVVSTQVDWQDELVHVRLVERPDARNTVGFVVEQRATSDNLASLRTHKAEDLFALDPAVAGATSGGISDPTAVNASGATTPAEKPKKKSGKGR